MMRSALSVVLLLSIGVADPAEARRKPAATWRASHTADPITGATSCTVAALDRAAGMRFTRTGGIYPVVELNSELGLLVGVSSGGKYRFPTGDIIWRVDSRPFRELKAQDNPMASPAVAPAPDVASAAMRDAMARASRLTAAITATSTMASGDKARDMLRELISGRALIYRQASPAATYGLANPQTQLVGQITRDGLVPFALDVSFHRAVAECGISPSQ